MGSKAAAPKLVQIGPGLFTAEPAVCPRCGSAFTAHVLSSQVGAAESEDLDLFQRGADLLPPEVELVECPTCALAFAPELFVPDADIGPGASTALNLVEFLSLRDPARPWSGYLRALAAAEALNYPPILRAWLALAGAWSARFHGEADDEADYLETAADLFAEAYPHESLDPQEALTAVYLAAECNRRLGAFGAAVALLDELDRRAKAVVGAEAAELRRRGKAVRAAVARRDYDPAQA